MFASVALAAAALTAAACGSSDDDPTATGTGTAATATASATTALATATATETGTGGLPVTMTDVDGREVEITDVSRIVVLNGDLAEVVYALGFGDNVVGVDISATYPPEAAAKQNIGYQRQLNAEGIISLAPTLVIGNEVAGPPEVLEQLRDSGITTLILKDVTTLDGVREKILAVAKALGVPEKGEELWAQTEAKIAEAVALAATAEESPRVAFLYLRGSSTQMLMGRGSRADVLITAAGGVDAGSELGINGAAPITAESLVAAAPDVILVLTAGLQSVGGIDGLLSIPGIAQTPAGQERRVVDMDDQYLLGLGPRTGEALMDLVQALHPELEGAQ
jgi:iron complex transport system substrate-binding protein